MRGSLRGVASTWNDERGGEYTSLIVDSTDKHAEEEHTILQLFQSGRTHGRGRSSTAGMTAKILSRSTSESLYNDMLQA